MIGTAPQYVNWNYTYACNLNCTHCYSRSPKYPRDLSTKQYLDIARQIVESNVFTVGFGGGEPTIREDFIEVAKVLASGGVNTHLTSNGTLIDRQYVSSLHEIGLGTLLISLDSHDKELNDKIRNFDGAYQVACRAIRMSVEAGLRTMIACVANALNYNALHSIVELAEDIGAHGVNIKIFRASGGAVQSREIYELSNSQQLRLKDIIAELRQNSALSIESYQDTSDAGCSCGITQVTIRPNGDVCLCPYASEVIGNLSVSSLNDIWVSSQMLASRRTGGGTCLSALSSTYPYSPTIPLTEIRK